MAFNTKIDSAGLTTLAGLGLLAFMDKKDKDKAKEKDKAGEALVKTAESTVKPAEPTKPAEPVKAAPEPQETKPRFRGNAAGAKPTEPQFKQYPTKQAAQTKAAMAGTADPWSERAKQGEPPVVRTPAPAPAKTTAPAPAKTSAPAPVKPTATTASTKPVGTRFGDKDRSLLDMAKDASKRREMERNKYSLASQMDPTKDMKKGGKVRSTASKRGDGIAKRGFTRA